MTMARTNLQWGVGLDSTDGLVPVGHVQSEVSSLHSDPGCDGESPVVMARQMNDGDGAPDE